MYLSDRSIHSSVFLLMSTHLVYLSTHLSVYFVRPFVYPFTHISI